MRKNLDPSKYLELLHSRVYQRHRFEKIQHGRTFVDRHYGRVLMEAMVIDLEAWFHRCRVLQVCVEENGHAFVP